MPISYNFYLDYLFFYLTSQKYFNNYFLKTNVKYNQNKKATLVFLEF